MSEVAGRVVSSVASVVDRAVTAVAVTAARRSRKVNRAESLGHDDRVRLLGAVAKLYEDAPSDFFRAPRRIVPTERLVAGRRDRGRTADLTWDSLHELHLPELAARYRRIAQNEQAHVRFLAHPRPTTAVILVHGYTAGQYVLEQRLWASGWMYRLGYDVAHFTLPFHGLRGDPLRPFPPFPNADPRLTIDGFRQALGDLRDFIEWLFARGHEQVGVMGMSLGGYTTALLATLEPRLAFAVPVIPLASIADFARDQGRLSRDPTEAEREHAALELAYRVVSPLHRAPVVAPERVQLIAARGDRITPVAHARRLAEHFGANLRLWPGGHILQFGRRQSYAAALAEFRKLGVLP